MEEHSEAWIIASELKKQNRRFFFMLVIETIVFTGIIITMLLKNINKDVSITGDNNSKVNYNESGIINEV